MSENAMQLELVAPVEFLPLSPTEQRFVSFVESRLPEGENRFRCYPRTAIAPSQEIRINTVNLRIENDRDTALEYADNPLSHCIEAGFLKAGVDLPLIELSFDQGVEYGEDDILRACKKMFIKTSDIDYEELDSDELVNTLLDDLEPKFSARK